MNSITSFTDCYPSRAFCLVHAHSGISATNATNKASTTQANTNGGMAVYNTSKKLGSTLRLKGQEQMARSLTAMPKSRIWTQRTKLEHRRLVKKQRSARMSVEKVSSKKFDYRPVSKAGASKSIDAHFRRQPRKGKYSTVSPKAIRIHRAKKFTLGGAVYGTGRVLPLIGAGYYVYDVMQSSDPVAKVARDLLWAVTNPLEFAYEGTGAGTAVRLNEKTVNEKSATIRTNSINEVLNQIFGLDIGKL